MVAPHQAPGRALCHQVCQHHHHAAVPTAAAAAARAAAARHLDLVPRRVHHQARARCQVKRVACLARQKQRDGPRCRRRSLPLAPLPLLLTLLLLLPRWILLPGGSGRRARWRAECPADCAAHHLGGAALPAKGDDRQLQHACARDKRGRLLESVRAPKAGGWESAEFIVKGSLQRQLHSDGGHGQIRSRLAP